MTEENLVEAKGEAPLVAQDSIEEIFEENKKRVTLTFMIGGIVFICLIITVLFLIFLPIGSGPEPRPVPLDENPYRMIKFSKNSPQSYTYLLLNERDTTNEEQAKKQKYLINSTNNFEPKCLQVNVVSLEDHVLNIKIYDPTNPRFEPPIFAKSTGKDEYIHYLQHYSLEQLGFKIQEDPFGFTLDGRYPDKKNGPILSTANRRLLFFDKFIEFLKT